MKTQFSPAVRPMFLGAGVLALVTALAHSTEAPDPSTNRYRVTITNITRGQIFSPSIAIGHGPGASVFTLGQSASAGLALLAEDGDPSMLAAMMAGNPAVTDVVTSNGPVMPGHSVEILVAAKQADTISVAGMLVSTNDAFFAIRALPTPSHGEVVVLARAYDSGTEANSEDCAFIPGPPCGMGGSHDPAPAEGYVHIHAGVHGGMSLDAAEFDWRGEVAEIRVERL